MARRRTIGFIELEWTCPNCSTRNPGRRKTCRNCGAPQPENVQFERPAEEKLVADDKALRQAQSGADIHCPFCGTRNPASAEVCSQCGGDLTEGARRASGRELGQASPTAKVVVCTNCGTENPTTRRMCAKCGAPLPRAAVGQPPATAAPIAAATAGTIKKPGSKAWVVIGALAVLACAAAAFLAFAPTQSVEATVADVYWQTSVPLQEMQSVSYTNERGGAPSDASDVSCYTDSRDVCEKRTIDRGNGYAEVVEDCNTVTEQYCSYRRDEWRTIQTYTEAGDDFSPFYAQPSISADQRLGEESVEYTVYFTTRAGQKTYSPDSYDEFARFRIGTSWTLRLNALGVVTSVSQ